MRKRPAALLVGAILLLFCVAVSGSSRTHHGYYTCLPGTLTALVLTNASEYASDEAFTVTVFDAHGVPMVSITDSLDTYQSKVLFLNDHIPEIDEFCWGSINIESELLLQVGLWLGTEAEWVSVSNLSAKTLSTDGYDVVYFWYGANYANTANRRTGIGLVNPGGAKPFMAQRTSTMHQGRFKATAISNSHPINLCISNLKPFFRLTEICGGSLMYAPPRPLSSLPSISMRTIG